MTPSGSVTDPVAEAIARASAGLSERDAIQFDEAMRRGLNQLGQDVPPEALVEEVKPAEQLPVAQRLQWAREFETRQEVGRLSRTSWNLLQRFTAHSQPQEALRAEATTLLEEARRFDQSRLKTATLREVRYDLGDVELECRYILSNGNGPISLRGGRLVKR